ncbi:MAG: ScaI family restriction endonuclease [Patescibacteria group bacterium]
MAKKAKDGYYLSVNFTKPIKGEKSYITKIKFGWLDHTDWIAQTAATGQQSRLTPEAKKQSWLTGTPRVLLP